MIRALVDFALNNRFVVIALAIMLLGFGAISFHNLPVEAYPDIADNYVTVITQWAGRSAEEVEQQVTVVDPIFWTQKRPFLRWWAALKMKENQCPERARTIRPA